MWSMINKSHNSNSNSNSGDSSSNNNNNYYFTHDNNARKLRYLQPALGTS